MTGNEYRKLIGRYLVKNYAARGLEIYEEVHLGTSIIGKQRRVDLFVVGRSGTVLAVECKYQDSAGTVDEKIPYALTDMRAQRVPGALVYAGRGFSPGVLHLLQGSEEAAYCLPDADTLETVARKNGPLDAGTWQLDHLLAQTFGFWDIVVGNRKPLTLEAPTRKSSSDAEQSKAPDGHQADALGNDSAEADKSQQGEQ